MSEIEKAWRTLRIDIAIARSYEQATDARNQVYGSGRLPWLEQLLPTLLFIRAMEVHDDAVADALAIRGEVLNGKNGRNTLKGRLLYCHKNWPDFNPRLITHADRRNAYGHNVSEHASWNDLDRCVEDIEGSLIAMGSILEPIQSVSVEYVRVSGSVATGVVWDAKILVRWPSGVFKQTWRTTETLKLRTGKTKNQL